MPRSHAIDQFHVGLRYGQRHAGIVHLLNSDAVRRLLHGLLHVDDTRTHGDELNEPRIAPGTELQHPTEAAVAATIGEKESKADWIDGVAPAMAVAFK